MCTFGLAAGTSKAAYSTQFPVPVDSYTAPVAKLFVTIETGKSAPPTPSGPVVMESV